MRPSVKILEKGQFFVPLQKVSISSYEAFIFSRAKTKNGVVLF